jgi:cytochrome c
MLMVASAIAALGGVAGIASAQLAVAPRLGSPLRGAQVFARCGRCHSLAPGSNMAGPSLHGLFGRKAGSAPGYRYSRAMRRSKLIWNEDTLSLYLADPRRFVPDDRMAAGCRIKDPTLMGDLLAYLERASR